MSSHQIAGITEKVPRCFESSPLVDIWWAKVITMAQKANSMVQSHTESDYHTLCIKLPQVGLKKEEGRLLEGYKRATKTEAS